MLADTPDVEGSTRANRHSLEERPEYAVRADEDTGMPVRRIGLEQEFFLVNRTGELCDLADHFLGRCWEAAETEGLDPRCFKAECAKRCLHGCLRRRQLAQPQRPSPAGDTL